MCPPLSVQVQHKSLKKSADGEKAIIPARVSLIHCVKVAGGCCPSAAGDAVRPFTMTYLPAGMLPSLPPVLFRIVSPLLIL